MYNLSNLSKIGGDTAGATQQPQQLQQLQQPYQSTMAEKAVNGLSTFSQWYAYLKGISLIIMGIIGLILFIYGIKFYFTDDSNWVKQSVVITGIKSTDNKTCDKQVLNSSTSTKNGVSNNQNIIYNCYIMYKLNDKEVMSQINNSSTNFTVGQTVDVYYDKNNLLAEPIVNKFFWSSLGPLFMIIGIIMMLIGFITSYFIYSNKDFATGYGAVNVVGDIIN